MFPAGVPLVYCAGSIHHSHNYDIVVNDACVKISATHWIPQINKHLCQVKKMSLTCINRLTMTSVESSFVRRLTSFSVLREVHNRPIVFLIRIMALSVKHLPNDAHSK
jgi:hypothetical protein